mmetsp:Transcript_19714/g.58443  ORF Transcript_19714/g.58443 Transcript_19714/m.58443 type:complete len:210 (-) Transcript_19714:851-1480(-)|eukprot:351592-Chlamydomonas_euryale.AAC.1
MVPGSNPSWMDKHVHASPPPLLPPPAAPPAALPAAPPAAAAIGSHTSHPAVLCANWSARSNGDSAGPNHTSAASDSEQPSGSCHRTPATPPTTPTPAPPALRLPAPIGPASACDPCRVDDAGASTAVCVPHPLASRQPAAWQPWRGPSGALPVAAVWQLPPAAELASAIPSQPDSRSAPQLPLPMPWLPAPLPQLPATSLQLPPQAPTG